MMMKSKLPFDKSETSDCHKESKWKRKTKFNKNQIQKTNKNYEQIILYT